MERNVRPPPEGLSHLPQGPLPGKVGAARNLSSYSIHHSHRLWATSSHSISHQTRCGHSSLPPPSFPPASRVPPAPDPFAFPQEDRAATLEKLKAAASELEETFLVTASKDVAAHWEIPTDSGKPLAAALRKVYDDPVAPYGAPPARPPREGVFAPNFCLWPGGRRERARLTREAGGPARPAPRRRRPDRRGDRAVHQAGGAAHHRALRPRILRYRLRDRPPGEPPRQPPSATLAPLEAPALLLSRPPPTRARRRPPPRGRPSAGVLRRQRDVRRARGAHRPGGRPPLARARRADGLGPGRGGVLAGWLPISPCRLLRRAGQNNAPR